MTPHARAARRIRRGLLIAVSVVALGAVGCVDGPFARVNPNDRELEYMMTLVSSTDTITVEDPTVVFQVITDPVITGYEPNWYISSGGLGVANLGHGVFKLTTTPVTTQSMEVTASFTGNSASRTITIKALP